jgi:predicted site-specific integrase-resolvase
MEVEMEVGLSEAARLLGISESTARRRLRSGELPGRQVPTKQGFTWRVEVDDDLVTDTPDSGELTAMRGLVNSLTEQNQLLKAQVQTQQEQLLAKDTQIGQLHVLLQQAQTALSTPRQGRPWWKRLFDRG